MKHLSTFAIALSAMILAPSAPAQDKGKPISKNDGTGYFGVTTLQSSLYPGSANDEFRVLPYLSFQNIKGFDFNGRNLRYRAIDVGTGGGLSLDKWTFRAGPQASWDSGREESDSPTLIGFEDIGTSIPLGGYARGSIGPIGLGLQLAQDVAGGHDGLTADASIGTFYRGGFINIQPAFVVSWADETYNDTFFGVTDAQSAASGLSTYTAGSGINSYGVSLVSWLEPRDNYAITVIGNYKWFTDTAKDSPILQAPDGSDNSFVLAIGVSRKFDTSKW